MKLQTSNFSAETGRNSGAAINVVTRSGTNSLKGTARYDFRDEQFDAPNYFAAKDAGGNRIKPPLEFRNFEGALGGPIRKNRLFFFAGQQHRTINRVHQPDTPDDADDRRAERQLRPRLRGADGIVGTADDTILRDPTTGQPFPGNVIPAEPDHARWPRDRQHLPRDDRRRRRVHRHADREQRDLSSSTTPSSRAQDIVRLDYQATAKQRIHVRYLHDKYNLIEPRGTFSARRCRRCRPTARGRAPATRSGTPGSSPNLINEAKVSASWNGQRIKPQGDFWLRDTYGFSYPEVFDRGRLRRRAASRTSPSAGFADAHRAVVRRCSRRPPTSPCRTR